MPTQELAEQLLSHILTLHQDLLEAKLVYEALKEEIRVAKQLARDALIRVEAMERTTHQVTYLPHPMPPDDEEITPMAPGDILAQILGPKDDIRGDYE